MARSKPFDKNMRRRKLVRLDLQLKIVFITLFVASLVLLINFQLSLAGHAHLESQMHDKIDVQRISDAIKQSTIQKFLFSVAMAVPLAGFVGILYSFKFCGPIYKFKKFFSELVAGRWDERCFLRKGDDLQDVCQAINDGMDGFRDQLRKNHSLAMDMQAFLAEAAFTVDGNTQMLLDRIRDGISEEENMFRERFADDWAAEQKAMAESSAPSADSPSATDAESSVQSESQTENESEAASAN